MEAVRPKSKKKTRGKSKVKQKEVLLDTEENLELQNEVQETSVEEGSGLEIHEQEVAEAPPLIDQPDGNRYQAVELQLQPENSTSETPQQKEELDVITESILQDNITESESCETHTNTFSTSKSSNEVPQILEATVSAPSAPECLTLYPLTSLMEQLELPNDPAEFVELSTFPLKFEDAAQAYVDMQLEEAKLQVKPFQESQMKVFDKTQLLDAEEAILEGFLNSQKDIESHELYESLSSYLRSRQALTLALEEVGRINEETDQLCDQLWTVALKKVYGQGECSDGRKVRADIEYSVAHFNAKACDHLARRLKERRQKVQDQVSLYSYQSTLYQLRVDWLVSAVEHQPHQLHTSISILFAFLRRPIRDRPVVEKIHHWLRFLVVRLLRQAQVPDFLLLAHHVIRLPTGLGRWARPYLQTPPYDPYGRPENVHHADVALSLLSLVCQPVGDRDDFLKTWLNDGSDDPAGPWVWLDSDGDDDDTAQPDAADASTVANAVLQLSDNDVLGLVSQIPVDNIFRAMLGVRQRDGCDVLDVGDGSLETSRWLGILARSGNLLRILDTGLTTYAAARYKNLAKKLGRLVLHVVCNLVDYWHHVHQVQEGHERVVVQDGAMMERLCVEYDKVVLRGLSILIGRRQQRLWQFLTLAPLAHLRRRAKFEFWWQLHRQIGCPPAATDADPSAAVERLDGQFWTVLVAALVQLPEPDLFVFLVTLSSLVDAQSPADDPLRQLVAWELSQLGLVDDVARPLCFKTAKEQLADQILQCPGLFSFLLHRLDAWLREEGAGGDGGGGAAALGLLRELPLDRWQPVSRDADVLRDWMVRHPLSSTQHQLAVTLLSALNWGRDEERGRPYVGRWMHRRAALILVEAVKVHGRAGPATAATLMPTLLVDSVQLVANLLRSWNASQLVAWAWRLVLRLRLHVLDVYPAHASWTLDHPHRALADVGRLDDEPQLGLIRDAVDAGDPLATFVALSLTDVGHVVPQWCTRGPQLLAQLVAAHCHQQALLVLDVVFPLLVHSASQELYGPAMVSVFQSLLQVDSTYLKMAKSLLVAQFPGTVLRLVASLIERTLANYSRWNLTTPWPLLEIWLNLLTRLPKWNVDKNVLYLLDVLVRAVLAESARSIQGLAVIKRTLLVRLMEPPVHRPSKGLASRVGSWVSGSSAGVEATSPAEVDATELLATSGATWPHLHWLVLELETERQRASWRALQSELQPGRPARGLDAALKAAAAAAKTPPLTAAQLCVVRYAHMAGQELPPAHVLQPLVLQRFFGLYLGRPDAAHADTWAVGGRVFQSFSGGAALLKNLQLRLNQSSDDSQASTQSQRCFLKAASLWLSDTKLFEPKVYVPTLAPMYWAERLLGVFQGDAAPWLDLYDGDGSVGAERLELRRLLSAEGRESAAVRGRSAATHGAAGGTRIGAEALLKRLSSYDRPCLLDDPQPGVAAPIRPPPPQLLMTPPAQLDAVFRPHLEVVKHSAEQFSRRVAELTALDCHFVELQAERYSEAAVEKVVAVRCAGGSVGDGPAATSCRGAGLIQLSFRPWKVDDGVVERLLANRGSCVELCRSMDAATRLASLCASALFVEHCTDVVCRLAAVRPEALQSGAALFYILVQLVGEETSAFLPTKHLLSTCIEQLGQQCIAGQPQQCRHLIELLSCNPQLAGILAPHFTPSTSRPTTATSQALVDCYRSIAGLSKKESDLTLVLLTKFDLGWWLRCGQSLAGHRAELLEVIAAALDKHGLTPQPRWLAVHEVLRRHWFQILSHDFGGQYGRVLGLVIASSASHSCSLALWCDLINTLGQGLLRYRPDTSVHEFRQQVLHYTTQQTLLDLHQLMETTKQLSQHFSRERQLHGLYGLYPRYRPYIEAIASLLMMIGHALCFATLQNDAGSGSDDLVGRLWLLIRDLYSPWLLPYTQQQVNADCAAWIQQLSTDRKLLLPWIAADGPLAASVVASLVACVAFLHETIPARQSALSHVLSFYFQGYCHAGMKPHICQVVHQGLQTLPWNTLTPSVRDLEEVVRVTGQFLPEAHTFLVGLVVRWPLKSLVDAWNLEPSAGCARVLTCLLHLYVRLAVEPSAKQNGAMRRLLDEAVAFPWHHIDAAVFEQVNNWYVSTCDPLFIIQPHVMEKTSTSSSAGNDALIFRLLQAAGGYGAEASASARHADGPAKRRALLRSWIRLMSTTVSRYRSVVQRHPAALTAAATDLLRLITARVVNGSELVGLLREYLTAVVSSSAAGEHLQTALTSWIRALPSRLTVETVLRAGMSLPAPPSGSVPVHLDRLALVVETALEHHDGSWSQAAALMGLPPPPPDGRLDPLHKDVAAAAIRTGCLLTWYGLAPEADPPRLFQQLVAGVKLLPLSESMEPKLALVYERLAALLDADGVRDAANSTPLLDELAGVLADWARDDKSWLSTLGLGKTPSLSPRGRCLARVVRCLLVEEVQCGEPLEKLLSDRSYIECRPAVEAALQWLPQCRRRPAGCSELLRRVVPLLYCRPYLTHLSAA